MAMEADAIYDIQGRRLKSSHITMDRVISTHPGSTSSGSIYLGGFKAANDEACMREANIGLIINCTGELPFSSWRERANGLKVMRFQVCSSEIRRAMRDGGLVAYMAPAFHKIHECFARGLNVMVHCRAGAHRAGTMACCLAVHCLHLHPNDALRHVRRYRRVVNVCGDNWDIVCQLYTEMQLRGGSRRPLQRLTPCHHPVQGLRRPLQRLKHYRRNPGRSSGSLPSTCRIRPGRSQVQ